MKTTTTQKDNFQPQKLSATEIANPYLVVYELFDYAHVPEIKEILLNWLKATVTGNYNQHLTRRERAELVFFFEKMERLVEAAHLIHVEKKDEIKAAIKLSKWEEEAALEA